MKKIIHLFLFLFIIVFTSSCSSQDNNNPAEPNINIDGYKLVWNDEFNVNGLPDIKKWGYDVGGSGWGNNELQYYTSFREKNARIEDGKLIIEAHGEIFEGKSYTSARLVTKGKGDWKYGRFEIRAKLPKGRGTWPAIWMLPTVWNYGGGGWPDNGEIDIMEHVGYDQNVVHASAHSLKYYWRINTQKTATITVPKASEEFHTYILEWDADKMTASVDDKLYFKCENEGKGWQYWPFDKAFHLILNIAIGGDWGGSKGIDNTIFPQRMEVEYVRVYEKL